MIILVPYAPETPKRHQPQLWQGFLFVLALSIAYGASEAVLEADRNYVQEVQSMVEFDASGQPFLPPKAHAFLRKRPLLKIAPAKADWDISRLLLSNFLHGSHIHLLLNLIGVFAGVRICSTFLSFFTTLAVFLLGGSAGLLVSTLLSSEFSAYIPHVGASAGIFSLMGVYYVYNFHYRTKYFFWLPTKHGNVSLRTSWFFFLDVLLLELVLSTGQLFPNRSDSIDHLAHVVGFAAGALMALALRQLSHWPNFLQIRAEKSYWRSKHFGHRPTLTELRPQVCFDLLAINPYNDLIKLQVCNWFSKGDAKCLEAIQYFSPTFVRLYPKQVGEALRGLFHAGISLPHKWLAQVPYDAIIQISRHLSAQNTPSQQSPLLELLEQYQSAKPEDSKLELLLNKLREQLTPGIALADSPGIAGAGNIQTPIAPDSKSKTAKEAS